MKPYQTIGYMLSQTTAITNVVSTRIYHGLRPLSGVMPCINYYEVGPITKKADIESVRYSLNCRADKPSTARDLARLVCNLFGGSQGNGITGTVGTSSVFGIARCSVILDAGLIPEPQEGAYNAPIDIQLVYSTSDVK